MNGVNGVNVFALPAARTTPAGSGDSLAGRDCGPLCGPGDGLAGLRGAVKALTPGRALGHVLPRPQVRDSSLGSGQTQPHTSLALACSKEIPVCQEPQMQVCHQPRLGLP